LKFSVVMPIYKDRDFLVYSLPTVFRLKPDEIVLLFDSTEEIEFTKRICRKFGFEDKTSFIDLTNISSRNWKCRVGFARRYGFQIATNDVILNTDADTLLDPLIRKYVQKIGEGPDKYVLIGFERKERLTFREFVRRIYTKISPLTRKAKVSAVYLFYRPAWLEAEDLEDLKKHPLLEDAHLQRALRNKGYKTLYVHSNCLHLRPLKDDPQTNYSRGVVYALEGAPLRRIMLRSFFQMRPAILVGFLHTRRIKNKEEGV